MIFWILILIVSLVCAAASLYFNTKGILRSAPAPCQKVRAK